MNIYVVIALVAALGGWSWWMQDLGYDRGKGAAETACQQARDDAEAKRKQEEQDHANKAKELEAKLAAERAKAARLLSAYNRAVRSAPSDCALDADRMRVVTEVLSGRNATVPAEHPSPVPDGARTPGDGSGR